MPHPREAIFDVLQVKREKAEEANRSASLTTSREQLFEDWNRANQRARSARG